MTNRTEEIRLAELQRDVERHPHRDELIKLMYQQVQEDKNESLILNLVSQPINL